jgi:hypothetical protein
MNYINHLKQMLVPGDKVMFIAKGRAHIMRIREGTYRGVSKSGSPQVTWKRDATRWLDKSGKVISWEPGAKAERYTADYTSTLHGGRVYKLA